MKIAVVGPSPVPFTIGGAENLLWGLCEAINKETEHQAELIKLPSREFDFWNLIQSYYDFYKLNLDQFDLVISTKYPSWMVRHRNCICYMVHTLRGLYDTYHFMNLPWKVERNNSHINEILDFMENKSQIEDLEKFFQLLFSLKNYTDIPDRFFSFPGAFIRKIVHYLDETALSQEGMKHVYAISKTIKYRKEYYPAGCKVDVVYPLTILKKRNFGEMRHIFIASRLDAPKRIDMLIRAMKYVKENIHLYIAGNGPQREEWERLAKNDKRIHFLGFVDDDTLENYYANSLVVPYFPYDEDYGLITIEAMLHQKPVITTLDAGGPTEFVIEGETGFITKFEEKAIADKIDFFIQNPCEAERMGKNAYEKVKNITWKNTVQELLSGEQIKKTGYKSRGDNLKKKREKKMKITVTTTFPIYPPQGGGQVRIYNLYKYLAKDYDIDIVSFTGADQKKYEGYIAEGLKEIRIPKTKKHQELEWKLEQKAQLPISDIGMITLSGYTEEYSKKLKESITTSELVILSHPYLYYAVKGYLDGRPFVYEAQDVEFVIKEGMLPDTPVKKELLQSIYQIEKECCEKSQFIITCSKEDQITLHKQYGVSLEKMVEVPNGVDCDEIQFTPIDERIANKQRLGLAYNSIGIFMGSWHQPNLEACEKIFEIASQCPKTQFLLVGSQCKYFQKKKLPDNVGLLGLVSEEVKAKVFETVDFALNPMLSGSGTNLKMFDYMASGIPIITTAFGTRGIENKDCFIVAEVEDMSMYINNISLGELEEKVNSARSYVAERFDWRKICTLLRKKVQDAFKK